MLLLKSKRFNIDVVIKLLILTGFSLFFFMTIKTGKVNQFVHPRIVPYMKFTIVAMLLISLFILRDVFKPQRNKVNYYQYLFFIIPLIMAFCLPAVDMNSASMSYSGTKPLAQTIENTKDTSSLKADNSSAASSQNSDTPVQNDAESENTGLKLHGDTIAMDDNFIMWVQEISDNPSKYIGKAVTVTAFVFKDKTFKSNEFVAARLMMVCCAADLSPAGLLAHYDKASELKQDSWFKFSGKIENGEFSGQQMPVIKIAKAEKVSKPKEEYVYPY